MFLYIVKINSKELKIDEHPNNFLIEKFKFVYNEINKLFKNKKVIIIGER